MTPPVDAGKPFVPLSGVSSGNRPMSEAIVSALIAGGVSLTIGLATLFGTLFIAERKLRRDYRLEFSAEVVVRELLSDRRWTLRSFTAIQHHVGGGLSDEALRQTLLRAGAIRFESEDGEERWGLLELNRHRLRP